MEVSEDSLLSPIIYKEDKCGQIIKRLFFMFVKFCTEKLYL